MSEQEETEIDSDSEINLEKNSDSDFAEMISKLNTSSIQVHIFHWQVKGQGSYAAHQAFGSYYEAIPEIIDEKEIARRRDFRDVTTFTIDPIDAKDFDDAISLHKLENGKTHELLNGLNLAKYNDGKIESYIEVGKNKKTLIVIEEDDVFAPIFLNTDKGKQSLFENLDAIQSV